VHEVVERSAIDHRLRPLQIEVKAKGSHRQFKHPSKPGRVTIAGKAGDDLAPKTFDSILREAGLKR
jgi:predicted RNA binding protein YcfA (HicA-like mRNA interferase family)